MLWFYGPTILTQVKPTVRINRFVCLALDPVYWLSVLPTKRADLGGAYGTAKAGVGLASMGVSKPDIVMRNIIPVVLAGILGIYGLIVAAILAGRGECPTQLYESVQDATTSARSKSVCVPCLPVLCTIALVLLSYLTVTPPVGGDDPHNTYASYDGYAHLASGLVCGLCSLAAGLAIGVVGDAGTRAIGQQEDLFVPMLLVNIFSEVLALYGFIVALMLSQKSSNGVCG